MPRIIDAIGPNVGKFDQSPGGGPWGASYGGTIMDGFDTARGRPTGSGFALGFGRGDIINTRKFQPDLIDRIYIALMERVDAYDPVTRSTAYALGAFGQPTTAGNSHRYKVIVAGTTGTTAPSWPTTSGATVTDGTVTWKEDGTDSPTVAQTWALAATLGASQLEADALSVISAYYEPITGYPSAPTAKHVYLRLQREMSSSGNELPITNDTDAANAVTFYRREIPKWRAMLAANGATLVVMHWNNCGGSGSNYANVLLAYPGDDMIDALGGDTYDSDDTGLYPPSFAPLWRRVIVGANSVAGATQISRASNAVNFAANDLVEIGTGTTRVEQATVLSNSGTTITFTAPLTKAHVGQVKDSSGNVTTVGDDVIKVYPVGAIVTNYSQHYISLVANNTSSPDPRPATSTSSWAHYPFNRIDGVTAAPGTNCFTTAQQAIAVDAQIKSFNIKFYGQKPDGSTTRYSVQFWYDFARTGVVPAGHSVDPRIPTSTGGKAFVIPEIGMFGLPSTNYKGATGGGDNFVWAQLFLNWCAAMKLRDGVGVAGWQWYNHNNGTSPNFTQVFATLPPWGTIPQVAGYGGAIVAPYFPRTGKVLLEGMKPSAQLRVNYTRTGDPVVSGTGVLITGGTGAFPAPAPNSGLVTATVGATV